MVQARKGKGGKGKRAGAARPPAKAARLPSGSYSWRGRAVAFSKLPKSEQARLRSGWAKKAGKTRARTKPIKHPVKGKVDREDLRSAKEWLRRRTKRLNLETPPALTPDEIIEKVSTPGVLASRTIQREAHVEWVRQGKHGGGKALVVSSMITDNLGAELAAMAPQLWYYH